MSTMFAQTPVPREQEFGPLLFSLAPVDPNVTPRSTTPQRGGAESMSAQRRSMNTSGSVHTEATPQAAPPPISRLDDVAMEDASTSGRQDMGMGSPGFSMRAAAQQQQQLQPSIAPAYEDVWVTIYGFQPADVPLILTQFQACGDILQWGTFGVPAANFIHVKFHNKFAAQRALKRNGEKVNSSLIVGVQPVQTADRLAIEEYNSAIPHDTQIRRPEVLADRPYRLQASTATQKVPVPTRSIAAKVAEFVFGM